MKTESITTFKASSLEVIETALLGSGLYLLAIWFGNGFLLDMEFVLKAIYNAMIVGACWMISDDWSCKWNNAIDLCIWQEYVGCALAYVATAGWAAMVYAPSAAFFLAGVIMLAAGVPAAILWFYFPYTHAVLEATPATLIKYEEGRCARKIGKAKTKAKLVSIFSKIVRTRYVSLTHEYIRARKDYESGARGELDRYGKHLKSVEIAGFVRMQAYGEGHKLRRPQFIPGFRSSRWESDGIRIVKVEP